MNSVPSDDFRAFSARIGRDPLLIQGPGGNTSVKDGDTMWIKASGMELAEAETKDIFVQVDCEAARKEVRGAGDGSCKAALVDPGAGLRPSIETTFHAALLWRVVAHTHSVATLTHVISPEGRASATEKLEDLDPVFVPYGKPGLPLTKAIEARVAPETRLVLLENHGLICCGDTVAETEDLMMCVEERLRLRPADCPAPAPIGPPMPAFEWASEENWLAHDGASRSLVRSGSYYPDHVVFLGPCLPVMDGPNKPPAVLVPDVGIQIRVNATAAQRAMMRCLSDVLRRFPKDWTAEPIGSDAEADLLNWDAEKYRQSLSGRR